MGYASIDNAYRNPSFFDGTTLLAAQEKLDGTSAHVKLQRQTEKTPEGTTFFGGCANPEAFRKLFSEDDLRNTFVQVCAEWPGLEALTLYGEAHGGKIQGKREVYGDALRFTAFDVRVCELGQERWLDVRGAEELVARFGIRFVDYRVVKATVAEADAERDRESVEAIRAGVGPGRWREGVVLKPLQERVDSRGSRLIVKHKRPDARETKTARDVSADQVQALEDARKIADEWVVPERVRHNASKLLAERLTKPDAGGDETLSMSDVPDLIRAVLADVRREAGNEIVWSREADRQVCTRAAVLFKKHLAGSLEGTP